MAFDTQLATGENQDVFFKELHAVQPAQLYSSQFALPTSFDGRKAWAAYLPPVEDQGMCGSCYSYAWSFVLGTRFSLLSGGQVTPRLTAVDAVICPLLQPGEDLALSHYTAVKNAPIGTSGIKQKHLRHELKAHEIRACHGDSLLNAAKFLFLVGATTTSCVPNSLLAAGTNLPTCEEIEDPTHTLSFNGCYKSRTAQRTFRLQNVYRLDLSDHHKRDQQIMYELAKFGPIVTAMFIFDDFIEFDPRVEIYTHSKSGTRLGGHAVAIVGWGDTPIPYWLIRNSWGPSWGDHGYFRMKRWIPQCELEANIIAGTPELLNTIHLTLPTLPSKFIQERQAFPIDLMTYYPLETKALIHAGTLKGDLAPIVRPDNLPDLGQFFSVLRVPRPTKLFKFIGSYSSRFWILALIGLLLLTGFILYWRHH